MELGGINRSEVYLKRTGALASSSEPRFSRIGEALLAYLAQRITRERSDFQRYTWEELKAACGATDSEFTAYRTVIKVFSLSQGGQFTDRWPPEATWNVPIFVVKIRRLQTLAQLHEFLCGFYPERAANGERETPGTNSASEGDVAMQQGSTVDVLAIFISHSSHDSELAEALIDLLRAALMLPTAQIRCTSVPGYGLPGGSSTDEQLRREVNDAAAFLGILSEASLRSSYVAFELGARWGSGKVFIPLLAPGISGSVLDRPLAGINALRLDSEEHAYQLVAELGRHLSLKVENVPAYKRQLDTLLKKAASSTRNAPADREGEDEDISPRVTDRTIEELDRHEEAKTLLLEASEDQSAIVTIRAPIGSFQIHTNRKQFVVQGEPRSRAAWEGALKLLCRFRLLEERGQKGELFAVTADGFSIADEIRRSRSM